MWWKAACPVSSSRSEKPDVPLLASLADSQLSASESRPVKSIQRQLAPWTAVVDAKRPFRLERLSCDIAAKGQPGHSTNRLCSVFRISHIQAMLKQVLAVDHFVSMPLPPG